jgi:hypothetical protein
MAQKIREGRNDAAVVGWARGILKSKGLDGRDRPGVKQQVGAILDELRASTIYAPDPYGTEMIASAGATLCLRPGLCLNGGDCDDLSVALGSATLSLGIPTMIVKQNFGKDAQEHVLIAVQDEKGEWLYADPSTKMPMGSALHANSEVWVDPMEPVGNMPEATAQLVTLGRPRHIERHGATWWEHAHGEWWRHDGGGWRNGVGAPPSVVGVTAGTPWQQVTDNSIKSGLRYQIKFVIDEVARAGDTPPTTADIKISLQSRFANDFLLETLDPTPDVTGGVQSWMLQGVAINDRILQDDPPGMGSVSFTSIAVQAQSPSTPAVIPDPTPPAAPPTTSYVSAGTVAVGALAVAAVGGVAWGMYRRKRRR